MRWRLTHYCFIATPNAAAVPVAFCTGLPRWLGCDVLIVTVDLGKSGKYQDKEAVAEDKACLPSRGTSPGDVSLRPLVVMGRHLHLLPHGRRMAQHPEEMSQRKQTCSETDRVPLY